MRKYLAFGLLGLTLVNNSIGTPAIRGEPEPITIGFERCPADLYLESKTNESAIGRWNSFSNELHYIGFHLERKKKPGRWVTDKPVLEIDEIRQAYSNECLDLGEDVRKDWNLFQDNED